MSCVIPCCMLWFFMEGEWAVRRMGWLDVCYESDSCGSTTDGVYPSAEKDNRTSMIHSTSIQRPYITLAISNLVLFLGKFEHRDMCPDIGMDKVIRKLRLMNVSWARERVANELDLTASEDLRVAGMWGVGGCRSVSVEEALKGALDSSSC